MSDEVRVVERRAGEENDLILSGLRDQARIALRNSSFSVDSYIDNSNIKQALYTTIGKIKSRLDHLQILLDTIKKYENLPR